MSTPVWPLPSVRPQYSGNGRQQQSNVIRKEMAVGEPKSRRRSTRRLVRYAGAWLLNDDQRRIFETWYENDIADGSLDFDWPDPETGLGLVRTWFTEDPAVVRLQPDLWRVSFSLVGRP